MTENFHNTLSESEHAPLSEQADILGRLALSDGSSGETALEESAEQVFRAGNLLVRALDAPDLRRNERGDLHLNYDTIDRETDDLAGRGDEHGLWYASSTLLLPGRQIPTYKNFGFMFDGATAELHHIHDQDSGSSGQGEDFLASKSDLTSLGELAEHIDGSDEAPIMNEVNATFKDGDLKGIFALEARRPTAKVSALLMRQRLKETIGRELPLYIYDIKAGEMAQWQPTDEEIKDVLDAAYRPGKIKDVYDRELGVLGSTTNDS